MAQASTVTVHSVIDLTQWNLTSPFGFGMIGTAPDTVSFKNGDTIILDIDFLGNQTLKFASLTGIGGAVLNTAADCPHSTASLVFHDYSGSGQAVVSGGLYQGCAAQLGARFDGSASGFAGSPIEFSGVTFTFADVVLSDNTLRFASSGRLDGGGLQASIGQLATPATPGDVPEPPGPALVGIAAGMLGLILRRRRQ